MLETPRARMVRIDKLLRQTISDLLRSRWGQEAVAITITGVETSPDLYDAKVFYSILTDDKALGVRFFRKNNGIISKAFAKEVVLKRTPKLHFIYDPTLKNAAAVERLLNEVEVSMLPAAKKVTKKAAKRNLKNDE